MGTNFYYKIPLKKREVKELRDMINETPDYNEIIYKLDEVKDSHEVHLGKRSYGWQFLWNYHNGKYYKPTLDSIKDFLENADGHIEDEYGEVFTIEQFFGDEIKNFLYKDDNHCDAYSYHEKHPEDPLTYDITQYEFTNDNLRFSKHDEFC